MKLYADNRGRLLRQIAFDAGLIVWIAAWIWLALRVRDEVGSSRTGAEKLETGAANLSGHMTDAGDKLTKVPLVGDTLDEPFTAASKAATQVSLAGHDLAVGIDQLGGLLGYLVASSPVALGLLVWCLVRLRYAARAGRAAALAKTPGGVNLLALQALTAVPPQELAGIAADPVAAWKADDGQVIGRLAAAQLGVLGLRIPPDRSAVPPERSAVPPERSVNLTERSTDLTERSVNPADDLN